MNNMHLRGEFNVATEEDRINLIANLIENGAKSAPVRELSLNILHEAGAREKNDMDEIKAIFNWVKKNIQYRRDVKCKDSYHTPERIVNLKSADCDDFSILLDSMLMSVGFTVGLRIISMRKDLPYHHIYALVNARGYGWVPLDASNKGYSTGEEPRWVKKRDFVLQCGD